MAMLGGEPQPFPALSAALLLQQQQQQYQQHHGTSGGTHFSLNQPLSRGLERALEEAASSGLLSLCGRKLKEFPRTSVSHDLSDTVQADLSKNRLTEVPVEVCHFVSLEALNLYQNCIKIIPDTVANLQMLTFLNLSRNQLSCLPACLCGLPLRVLICSNNKLGSLPKEIGQLQQLMELDVSCNEITALPQQVGLLKSLRDLNVRRNHLNVLPQELADLPLVKFDFSCNKVLMIPICFRKMTQLQVLRLENNPLHAPPAQICTKGKVHIFKYLSIQACQIDKTADSLYLHAIERPHLQQHAEESIEDIYPAKKDSDSGVGSDNGDKRLSAIEPSDEDSTSLTVPMSNIIEEEHGIMRKDSSQHLLAMKVESNTEPSPLIGGDESEEIGHQFADGEEALTDGFMSYIKVRTAEYDEPLQIEEDTHWTSEEIESVSDEQAISTPMIDQLIKAVCLLQDPNRLSVSTDDSDGVNLYPLQTSAVSETEESLVNGQTELEMSPIDQNEFIIQDLESHSFQDEAEDRSPPVSPAASSTAAFGLKPRSVFLRPPRKLESVDPQFTIRRKMEQMREEKELIDQLRENIEVRLKICLPGDLGSALMDGVVLCHLVNHIRPRSVGSIHVPSPAVPKLSMAKCRRNVENFLDACRKMGVPEEKLCLPHHILEEKGLVKVSVTILALLDATSVKQALCI
ncbi:leucine-rich repeat and calponin homology domain-containing protein 1 isoform X2 [Rhinatrema bivittatum]|uniref:leucine-rich repeat and calponin homology domain-containing protein 1 isoform X2 n=1 Tax=Rhinatrema bivittatum TaxID=194408 RepID=UPI00112E3C72|nr:leucine-rich repeat and calponin homology domain-containing protein 1 isoform X2 [Rhinatrema bivittatum]